MLLAVGAVAYGAVKLTRKDADRAEQHTGTSVEELSDEDKAALGAEANQQP